MRTAAALLGALLAGSCGGGGADLPNVVLLSLDTLRADHLSCYGYGIPTSPELDTFAAGATRWTECYSTAPWTLPAHASLFTGLFPGEHGAHTTQLAPDRSTVRPLEEDFVTLAEVLPPRVTPPRPS